MYPMINPKKKKEITSSSNKLIIRESLPADAENIYSFLIDVIPETYSYISGGDLFRGELLNNDEYRNYARETYQNNDINRCVVLTDDDSIWGIIALKRLPNLEFEVHSLYVHQRQRLRQSTARKFRVANTNDVKDGHRCSRRQR